MRRRRKVSQLVLAATHLVGTPLVLTSWLGAPVLAQNPPAKVVKQPPPSVQPPPSTQPPPSVQPPPPDQPSPSVAPPTDASPTAPTPFTPSASAAALGTAVESRAPQNTVDPVASSVNLAGGQAAPTLNAPDLGELLSKSPAAAGVEVQRRNAVISDPRIRGYRVGQFETLGDQAWFFPARQDLDTAVAKFDPGTIRDIVIVKGPYTSLYGSGFAFLDIATLDAPRYKCPETHGRTAIGYQTNGDRWDGLQSVFTGDRDWGFRATYNILTGSDYRAGNGQDIASSYNSQNVNFALGFDLSPNSKVEFKGLRVHQQDLEFPGLYFDIHNLDTEAYNARYTLVNTPYFDRLTLDAWYNTTVADGDTRSQGAKQAFVQQLLNVSFNFPTFPQGQPFPPGLVGPLAFQDFSTTRFSNKSLGYRAAASWGEQGKALLTVGTDLNVLGQALTENILFQQTAGPPVAAGGSPVGALPLLNQVQGIPRSSWTDPGLFAELSLPVNDRLKVKVGGRADFVGTDSDPRRITGNIDLFGPPGFPGTAPAFSRFDVDPIIYSTNPTNTDLSKQFNLFAGFLTTEYVIDEHLTAIAAGGYAQRAPTLTELYAAGPFIGVLQQGTSRLIGDPNLEKERLTQFDVGLKADYGWYRGGVTGFYAEVNDYITFDANKLGEGLTQVVFTNTDRATLAGGEMFAILDVTSWLTPFGNLAYVQGVDHTHADNRRPANLASSRRNSLITGERAAATEPLPQIPQLDSRAGIRIHESIRRPTDAPRWTVEVSARMAAGRDDVAASLGELATPGFTVFDVRSFWQVNDRWLVSAGVENFGDRTYRGHLDPISGNLIGVGPLFRPGTNYYFASQLTY